MNGNFFRKATVSTLVIFLILSLIPFVFILGSIEYIKVPSSSELSVGFVEYLNDPSKFGYGYIPPPFDVKHLKKIIPNKYLKDDSLPSQFDWRTQNGVTSVKNQSNCGTCWIFGTTSVLESKALINEGILYDFSEQSVALCSDKFWTYLFDGSNDPCMAGGWSYLAAEAFIRKGAKLESCLPYNVPSLKCDGSCLCDNCPPVKRVSGYRLVTDDKSNISLIKQAIYNNGPVTGSFYYESKYLYNDQTFGYFYDANTTNSPNHLISIVGWNDEVPHKNTPGIGAWIVKNSWGTSWGNSGYFYLAYDSSGLEEISYLLYDDYKTGESLYTLDESSMLGGMGYGDHDAWMASVYTAQTSGQLTKVEFWVPSANASYWIYVYEGKLGSKILAESNGLLQEAGYYSIALESPVVVEQSETFTIAVKLSTPGYTYPIPVEFSLGSIAQPEIQTGVTFIRNSDSDPWVDTSIYGKNVCLRAVINQSPSIDISQPNGFETLKGNLTYPVKWGAEFLADGKIKILFSPNAGSSWSTVETDIPLLQTSYNWTVPTDINSSNCIIRVGNYDTSTGDWIVYDDSDNTFTVTTQDNYFKTTYPVGTEIISTSTLHVTWDVEGFTGTEGKIRILYYTGGGGLYNSWYMVAANINLADGSFDIDTSAYPTAIL